MTAAQARQPEAPPARDQELLTLQRFSVSRVASLLRQRGDFHALAAFCRGVGARASACGRRGSTGVLSASQRAGARNFWGPEPEQALYDWDFATRGQPQLVHRGSTAPSADPLLQRVFEHNRITYGAFATLLGHTLATTKGHLFSDVRYGREENASSDRGLVTYHGGLGAFEVDLTGHERGHDLIAQTADLGDTDEPGALGEHFADVFGQTVLQWSRGERVEQAPWIAFWRLVDPKVRNSGPERSLANPALSAQPQPRHLREMATGAGAKGRTHHNSGIPNHAFYLAARRIGGHVWDAPARIWYVALRDHLDARSNFADTARATVQVAGDLYGVGSREQRAVARSWKDVGIAVPASDARMPVITRRPARR